ncbi:MAG: hypothetical protein HKN80_01445 [Acidimicrobiia bacterium]|nr:hypothetical protein [Acidimicrobiia bacterium]
MLLAACGNVAETVAEQIAEEASGGNVEIDLDDEGANLSIETDDGSMEVGSDLEIPDALAVDVPGGGSVTTVFDFESELSVVVSYDIAEFDDHIDFYESWTGDQSEEFQASTSEFDSADGISFRTAAWFGDAGTAINLTSCRSAESTEDDPDAVCLTITQSK